MRLALGEFVVHPQHGPAEVVERTNRTVKGEDVTYVVLDVKAKGLRITMPEKNLSEVGVRNLSSHTQVRKLMSLMQKTGEPLEEQWSRRLKVLREKLASGDLAKVAEVVRDMYRRDQEKELSTAERDVHREAVDMLATEIALVLQVDAEEAEATMIRAIDGTPLTQLGLDRGKEKKNSQKGKQETAA